MVAPCLHLSSGTLKLTPGVDPLPQVSRLKEHLTEHGESLSQTHMRGGLSLEGGHTSDPAAFSRPFSSSTSARLLVSWDVSIEILSEKVLLYTQ